MTGATGFLGGHIVKRLLRRNAEVIGLYRDLHKNSYIDLECLVVPHMVKGDVTSLAEMSRIITDYEVEYVFHLAANPIVRKCSLDPLGCFQANIMGTATVLEAARRAGTVKGVLCMESDKSYGSFDEADLPYREDQALKPSNVYEVSKACAGYVARGYNYNYDLPVFTVRGANLYGPGDMNLSRLIPGSILRLLRDEQPVLYGGVADYVREFIFVGDTAEICIMLMEQISETRGRTINVGSGDTFRVGALMDKICEAVRFDLKPRIVERASTFQEIEKQWLDLTLMNSFIPHDYQLLPMEEGLDRTVKWYTRYRKFGVR